MIFKWIPCHRKIERSIRFGSFVFPLCARCTAILVGYLFLPITFIFQSIFVWWHIPLLMLPLLIDGYTQKWKWRESNNVLRFITGLLFGTAHCILIVKTVLLFTKILT